MSELQPTVHDYGLLLGNSIQLPLKEEVNRRGFVPEPCNAHTVWFDPQMEKLEPHYIVKQTVPQNSTVQ